MKLCNLGHDFDYELEKLIRLFLPFEKIEILRKSETCDRTAICARSDDGSLYTALRLDGRCEERTMRLKASEFNDEKLCELRLAQMLFDCFVKITGCRPKWGILTGVRPAKLFSRISSADGIEAAQRYFENELFVDKSKISLCRQAVEGERKITELSRPESFSLYLSVPFCPSRCSYCSFVSHSVDKAKNLIPRYVELLCDELEQTAKIVKALGLRLETVYMGGGTPTVLSAEQLSKVLGTVNSAFDLSMLREYTVEAGRPDTITPEKLSAIYRAGVTRISINPQTMNDRVLEHIGRKHTARQTEEAFVMARECGFKNINTDLIAGLPTDTLESFSNTLDRIARLDPESVTVHALSMKRASRLTTDGSLPEDAVGETASAMVDLARERLDRGGIFPYYMYRQSKTVGNLENVGYAKRGAECLYNVYIMDETHTILGCGASAVTKLREPGGANISRIFNFKYPYEYIDRYSEQLARKDGIAEFYGKFVK